MVLCTKHTLNSFLVFLQDLNSVVLTTDQEKGLLQVLIAVVVLLAKGLNRFALLHDLVLQGLHLFLNSFVLQLSTLLLASQRLLQVVNSFIFQLGAFFLASQGPLQVLYPDLHGLQLFLHGI